MVVAGIPVESHAEAVALLACTEKAGANEVVSVMPYYVRPQALAAARRAIELDGEDPWGHLALGYVHMHAPRFLLIRFLIFLSRALSRGVLP
jgi:hypothetical protein